MSYVLKSLSLLFISHIDLSKMYATFGVVKKKPVLARRFSLSVNYAAANSAALIGLYCCCFIPFHIKPVYVK